MSWNRKEITWVVVEGGCWRCTSHKIDATTGYPVMTRLCKKWSVARWLMLEKFGEQPTSIDTRHTCDHRWCINPDHLLKGTRLDNVQDMISRGRYVGWNALHNFRNHAAENLA